MGVILFPNLHPYLCRAGNNSPNPLRRLIGPDTKTVVFGIRTPDYKIYRVAGLGGGLASRPDDADDDADDDDDDDANDSRY